MRLVTFDLDGVLQNNPFTGHVLPTLARLIGPYFGEHQSCLLRHRNPGISPTPAEIKLPGLNHQECEVIAAIFAQIALRLANGELRAAYDWDAATATVAQAVGCDRYPSVTELVEEGCRLGHISAFIGAGPTLQELSDSGTPLVALSNGFTRYQRPVMDALGLSPYFLALVSPEEAGTAKPDPEIFRAAGTAVGITDLQSAFHVGDTLIHDIVGAKAAGMRVLWMYPQLPSDIAAYPPWQRAHHAKLPQLLATVASQEFAAGLYDFTPDQLQPDAVVTSLEEIPTTIRQLSASSVNRPFIA